MSLNPRLEGVIRRFAQTKGLTGNLPLLTEHFANYVILREEYFNFNTEYPFESEINKELLENLNFGENSTECIDGFFCITGNSKEIIHIDSTKEEILSIINPYKSVKIHIVLIQTKTSKFDATNISGLVTRLSSKSENQENWEKFFKFRKVIEQLLMEKSDFDIKFSIVYFSGEKIDSNLLKIENFTYKLDALKETVKNCFWMNDVKDVKIEFYDAQQLMNFHTLQSKAAEAVHKTVDLHQMTNTITCREADKTEMRLGLIKISQLKKILHDGKRPYQLYEYNVRHNLRETPPNEKMKATLCSKTENFKFPLLNNGITIIVDSMFRKGDSAVELKNIRIVNGCQTSHVILQNCIDNSTYDEILIPLKMIATKDQTLLSEITYASNNQNPIKTENLFSLNKNIILLEAEYEEFNILYEKKIVNKFYFERRQGQWASVDNNFVIDIPAQSKIFIASWFAKPHHALQYKDKTLAEYHKLIDSYGGKDLESFFSLSIFVGALWCKIYKNIRSTNYEPARYHILCGVIFAAIEKYLSEDYLKQDDTAKLSTCFGKIKEIQESLLSLLTNSEQLENEINKVIQIIDSDPLKDHLRPSIKGKIHYRRFYLTHIISSILDKLSSQNR